MDEIEVLTGRFKSKDFSTRRLAAKKLGELGDDRGVRPLIRLLGDDAWQVRNTVIDALIKIRDNSSIQPLIDCLGDEEPSIRNSAMSVLNEMGEDVIKPLTELLLGGGSEALRIFCAITLGHFKSSENVAALISVLKDNAENIRHAAVEALGNIGSPDAVVPLIEALKKESRWSQFPYIYALGKIGDERACPVCIEALDDEILCYPAVIALGNIGDIAGLDPLLEMVGKSDDPTILKACAVGLADIVFSVETFAKIERQTYFHSAAIKRIKRIDSESFFGILVKLLHSQDLREWQSAFLLLRYVKGRLPLPELFGLFTDENKEDNLRELIIQAGAVGLKEIKDTLKSPEKEIQSNLIRIIGVLGEPGDGNCLIPFLDSPSSELVSDTLKSLGMLNAAGSFDRMAEFLASNEETVRNSAVGGIAMLADKKITGKVKAILDSENEYVRRGGYRILGFNKVPGVIEALIEGLIDASPIVRSGAVQSLGYIGVSHKGLMENKGNAEALTRMLMDEDIDVKIEAVLALGRINHAETNDMLIEVLDSYESILRRHTIRSIGNVGLGKAVPSLCALMQKEKDIENRIFICTALGQLGDSRALPVLMEALEDSEPEVTAEAIIAIGSIGSESDAKKIEPYLDSPKWIIKNAALKAIYDLCASSATQAVIDLVENIRSERTEGILLRKSIEVVGKTGAPENADLIVSFLPDERCRYEAFNGLGTIWQRHAFSYDLAGIKNAEARRLACSVLGDLKMPSASDALASCLEDEYPSVCRAAALAIRSTGGQEAVRSMESAGKETSDYWMKEIYLDDFKRKEQR
ncbi:MAG: HEAT repeat domain-containing protein [Nitrospinota bacterium]